jgi:hypothetical protein
VTALRHDPRIRKRIKEVVERARKSPVRDERLIKGMLRALLPILAQVFPVTAALMLFTNGASGIYQAYRAHKLVDEVEQDEQARLMLADLESRIEHMPAEQAEKVLKVLLSAQGDKAERTAK